MFEPRSDRRQEEAINIKHKNHTIKYIYDVKQKGNKKKYISFMVLFLGSEMLKVKKVKKKKSI